MQFPGFIRHCLEEPILKILGTDHSQENSFDFPVDMEFHQWYRAETADPDVHAEIAHRRLLQEICGEDIDNDKGPLQFAIMISRPNPRETVPEIGLLVKICESVSSKNEFDVRQKNIIEHYCRIIHRVKVSRLIDHEEKKARMPDYKRISEAADYYSEVLGFEQIWFVNGFHPDD